MVVLGIDAANPDLLRRGCEDGSLPTLAFLTERGTQGSLQNVEGFHIGSTWPSFYTGTGPAEHGFHYLVQLAPNSYEYRRVTETGLVQRPPFWSALSEAGKRVAVLDVPLTALDPGLNGIQVVEWGGHDSVYGFCTSPPSLAKELIGTFGTHPQGPVCDGVRTSAADYERFIQALLEGVEKKTAMTRELLAREPWDFFMQVFTESHCVGHQAWHLHDPSHPAFDADLAAAVGDPVMRVYQAIDRAIGEILADCGDAAVLVFTAHGMDHWYGAQFLLPEIVERMGWATPLPPPRVPSRGWIYQAARGVWRMLPATLRARLRPHLARRESAPTTPTLGIDPKRTVCFVQLNGLAVGGLRLNLVGREPEGQVTPGAEAAALEDEIERELLAIVNKDTGRRLIRRVLRTRDNHQGEHLDTLPDLLVEWDPEHVVGAQPLADGRGATVRAHSPRLGDLEGTNTYGRSGENRPEGWFVATGGRAAQGRETAPPPLVRLAAEVLGFFEVGEHEARGLWNGES